MTISLLNELSRVRAVPVIRSNEADEAIAIGQSLASGGLTVIEATFTTPNVERVISTLCEDAKILVGAGTVLTEVQARRAVAAGAKFLVSPVWLPWLPELAAELGVDAVPGAATPSEIWAASSSGATAVKIFPIARLGGPAYIRDLLAPLPSLNIVATGGADLAMARSLIQAGCIAVGLGSIHRDTELGDDIRTRAAYVVRDLAKVETSEHDTSGGSPAI